MKISNCGLALMYLAIPFVLIVSPFIVLTKWHDWQLGQLQREIETLSHPANSTFLARHGEIGNFGNGNHIDYWAVELHSITGQRSVLKTSYGNIRVLVPNAEDDGYDQVS